MFFTRLLSALAGALLLLSMPAFATMNVETPPAVQHMQEETINNPFPDEEFADPYDMLALILRRMIEGGGFGAH